LEKDTEREEEEGFFTVKGYVPGTKKKRVSPLRGVSQRLTSIQKRLKPRGERAKGHVKRTVKRRLPKRRKKSK
jgi:hypothetical protein